MEEAVPAHPRHREVTHREVELAADAVAGGGLCLHAIFNYLAVSRSLQEFFSFCSLFLGLFRFSYAKPTRQKNSFSYNFS